MGNIQDKANHTMSVKAMSLQMYLDSLGIPLVLLPHDIATDEYHAAKLAAIPLQKLIRVVALKDKNGAVLCILPAAHLLDLSKVRELSERILEPIPPSELSHYFKEHTPGCLPPFPALYHLNVMLDVALLNEAQLYFCVPTLDAVAEISRDAFQRACGEAWQGSFSVGTEALQAHVKKQLAAQPSSGKAFLPTRLKSRVEETKDLPVLPPMADRILKLRVDPNADAKKLAGLVEQDPSLAAQVLSWSRSPYYGYSGKIESIEEAIIKVLGFDLVMNLALGIACGKEIKIEKQGPLGLIAYWKFALYTASLCEHLRREMTIEPVPKRGLLYLCGLLHNFGVLLMAQLFPPQFKLMGEYVILNPYHSLFLIEQYVLGMGHTQFGGWLFRAWHLPDEVVAAAESHHVFVHEDGNVVLYVGMVQLATCLLKRIDLGDAIDSDLPPALLKQLGLEEEDVLKAFAAFLEHKEDLDKLVSELVH